MKEASTGFEFGDRRRVPVNFWLALAVLAFAALPVSAHVGDQNVFFEGHAGRYPVRVVVRPPGVIPGLAEISVRVQTNGVERVTVLPIRWNTGRKGAPPADDTKPVRGETNLFSGELWFMREGAQSVEVAVVGNAGRGTVIVPVNAVATRVLGMSNGLGRMLSCLGILLVALAASIAGAAVRESVLPAGASLSEKRRWFARGTVCTAAAAIVAILFFGNRWWNAEANDYRNNRLYQPLEAKVRVRLENGQRILTIERPADRKQNSPLVPEHGKLMHLFLVHEPGMTAFAHLHPMRMNWKTFEAPLPELPEGDYTIYADVTYETGFADTLTAKIHLPASSADSAASSMEPDGDDAWIIAGAALAPTPASGQNVVALSPGLSMHFSTGGELLENRDTQLRFVVHDAKGMPVALDSYMGMGGHLIIRREDGAIFTHLHPSGSYSMTAQQLFELRAEGKAPLRTGTMTGEPICKLSKAPNESSPGEQISFPYAFPKPGLYRLWAQVKVNGKVLTGVFDVKVLPADRRRAA